MSAKKEGLDYFPFSVDLLDDEKLDILREEYGVVVNDVYISLLCLLYKKKGYYIPYETDVEKKDCIWYIYKHVRGGKYPVKQNAIPQVIESLVSQGLFSGRYFPKIITSERAQRTYYSATVERKADSLNINLEYWMLSKEDMEKLSKKHPYYLSCTHFSKSTDLERKSDELDCKSTDLSLKESKVKESKYIPPNPLQGGGKEEWKEKFFQKYTVFEKKRYNDDGIDYELLYKEFEQSQNLRKMWSFATVIRLYENIKRGDFRDKQSVGDYKAERERYYASVRSDAEVIAEANKKKASANPRFMEIEKRLSLMEIELAKAELYDTAKLSGLENEKRELTLERGKILSKMGLKSTDLLPSVKCTTCGDTGVTSEGTECKCYLKR